MTADQLMGGNFVPVGQGFGGGPFPGSALRGGEGSPFADHFLTRAKSGGPLWGHRFLDPVQAILNGGGGLKVVKGLKRGPLRWAGVLQGLKAYVGGLHRCTGGGCGGLCGGLGGDVAGDLCFGVCCVHGAILLLGLGLRNEINATAIDFKSVDRAKVGGGGFLPVNKEPADLV